MSAILPLQLLDPLRPLGGELFELADPRFEFGNPFITRADLVFEIAGVPVDFGTGGQVRYPLRCLRVVSALAKPCRSVWKKRAPPANS